MNKKTINKLLKTILLIIIIIIIAISGKVEAASKVKLGDINHDGKIDQTDLLKITRHMAAASDNKNTNWILKDKEFKLADVNENKKIDTSDMLAILRYIAANKSKEIAKKHQSWMNLKAIEIEDEPTPKPTPLPEPEPTPTPTPTPKVIEVKNIKLDKPSINLDLTGTKTAIIKPTLEPSNATNKEITWISSNNSIVEVDTNGNVKAKTNGNAQITAKTANGKTATCKVSVKTTPTNISFTKSKDTIEIENIGQLLAKVGPAGAEIKDVEWTNNNQDKVAVERVIEGGTYYIKTALDERKVLDVANGSKDNNARIQIFDKNETEAQKFEITNVGNEYYKIISKNSGKAIDVKNGEKTNGTKVQQYTYNGTDSQKWEFEYAGGENYYIKSKVNGLYLDVSEGKAINEKQLQVWTENRSNAQKYKLEQIERKTQLVANGTYYIKSGLNESKVLDVENGLKDDKAKIQIFNKNETEAQKFEIIYIGNGNYIIRSKLSGKVLDIKDGKNEKGTKIQQYSINGTNAQIWKLEKDGEYYRFKSKSSGLYLDVTDAKAEDRAQLQVWTGNNNKAQKFKLEKISSETKYENIEYVILKAKKEGTATITAKLKNGKTATCTITAKNQNITGGQAIAESAVQLACRALPESTLFSEWSDTRIYNNRTKAYVDAKDKYIGNSTKEFDGGGYASCAMAVATAVRYSKVDSKMEYDTIVKQWPYLKNSNNWKNVGSASFSSTSNLQPGDVLINNHHILIFVGNKTVRRKYSNSSADIFEAGYSDYRNGSYYPALHKLSSRNWDNTFTIFRHVNWNKKLYKKIL